jgi:hypothetical protein
VGGSGAAGGKSAAAAMPGVSARTIETAKRVLFSDIRTTNMSTMPPSGSSRRIPIQQEFPE